MAGKSNFLEGAMLDFFLLTGAAPTRPTSLVIRLFTDATVLDLETGTNGTEVSGGGYVAQPITFSRTAGVATTNADVLFPVATAAWGNIRYFRINDNAGNLLYAGQFTTDKAIGTDDQFKITAGQLTITED